MTARIPKCFKTLTWLRGYQSVLRRLHDYEDTKVLLNAYMTARIPKCFKMVIWLLGYQGVIKCLHDC
jgi:hypothetical protein